MRLLTASPMKMLGMTLAFALLAALVVIPLLLIFWTSIYRDGVFRLLAPLQTIMEGNLAQVFVNSIWLGFCVVVGATLLALPMAFLMAKTEMGRSRWVDVVLLIPFMTPPYIGSMGWILFMQPAGYLQQVMPFLGFLSEPFFSLMGMITIMSLHLFPFLYLMLRNSLRKVAGGLEEAGEVHGGSFMYRLRRIILPLLLSSYTMGALLVFVKTIAEFGTPATFGRRIGYYVLTTEIHKYTSHWPIDFGKAASLASILLGACLLFWYMQSIIMQRFTYAIIGGKGSRQRMYKFTAWQRIGAYSYMFLLMALSIGVPYFSILATSLTKLRGYGLQWGNYTLEHYKQLLTWGSSGMSALMNSLGLSLFAATIAMVLGTYLALLIGRGLKLSQKWTDVFSLLPNTVPGIVIIVGMILLWNAPWMPIPIYNTYFMVVLAYVVLFLPYTVQYVKAGAGQIDRSLLQAAQVFGGSAAYNFRRILLPLLLPGMLAGWMMTFTISIRELVASLMILPPSMVTSATYIYAQFEQGSASLGMAMAFISVGLTTAILLVLNRFGANQT